MREDFVSVLPAVFNEDGSLILICEDDQSENPRLLTYDINKWLANPKNTLVVDDHWLMYEILLLIIKKLNTLHSRSLSFLTIALIIVDVVFSPWWSHILLFDIKLWITLMAELTQLLPWVILRVATSHIDMLASLLLIEGRMSDWKFGIWLLLWNYNIRLSQSYFVFTSWCYTNSTSHLIILGCELARVLSYHDVLGIELGRVLLYCSFIKCFLQSLSLFVTYHNPLLNFTSL